MTQGLQDTFDQAETRLTPFLVDQALDDKYAKEGEEFIAYTNLQNARQAGESAKLAVEENKEEEVHLAREFNDAKWALDNANNQEEYIYAKEWYDDVKARKEALDKTLSEARDTIEQLEGHLEDLEGEYNRLKGEREAFAKILTDNGLEAGEFDPAEGGPEEPEESILSNLLRIGTFGWYDAHDDKDPNTKVLDITF